MRSLRRIIVICVLVTGLFILCWSLVGWNFFIGSISGFNLAKPVVSLSRKIPNVSFRFGDNSDALIDDYHKIPNAHHKFPDGQKHLAFVNKRRNKRIIVAGGAGFVGSHLVDSLMQDGHIITVLDNFFTGEKGNIYRWVGHPRFELIHHDVSNPIFLEADEVYHLASPASPPNYMANPIKTMKANLLGSINLLGLARRVGAKFLFASSSEIYGDPSAHPQSETYWGNVNPDGPRSCYDESKRASESLAYAYLRKEGVQVRIARIFNTYGPRMQFNDGRVVSNFILQAISNQDISVYGDGSFTRSFMYISDLVDGLMRLMSSNVTDPVNLGNPHEFSIEELAHIVKNLTGSSSKIIHKPEAVDDPKRRKPDIERARRLLNWNPKVELHEGLQLTIKAFRESLRANPGHGSPKSGEKLRLEGL